MELNELGQTMIRVTPEMIGIEPPSSDAAQWPAQDISGRATSGSRNVTKHYIGTGRFVIVPVEFTNYVLVVATPAKTPTATISNLTATKPASG